MMWPDIVFEVVKRLIRAWDRGETSRDVADQDARLLVRREHAIEARRRQLASKDKKSP